MAIRIGTGSTNTSISTSERIYLNCTQSDGIVMKSSVVNALNVVFNDTSRFGNSNKTFFMQEGNQTYLRASCNNMKIYDTFAISSSNIQSIGNMSVSELLTAKDMSNMNMYVASNLVASSNIYTTNIHTTNLTYQNRRFVYFDRTSVEKTTIDSDVKITGYLVLDKPLSLQNAVIDNVRFNSNVVFPSVTFIPQNNGHYHAIDIQHDSNNSISGCNLLNIQISGTPSVVVNTQGNMGINTATPTALLDMYTSTRSGIDIFRTTSASNNVTINHECQLGIGTSTCLHKFHIFDCNIRQSDGITHLPAVVGIYLDSSNADCSPILAAQSNANQVLYVSANGATTIGNVVEDSTMMLNVGGTISTPAISVSSIYPSSNSTDNTINVCASSLSNIQDVYSCNMYTTGNCSALTVFGDTVFTCNLNLPNVAVNESYSSFGNDFYFTGDHITIGSSEDTALQIQPYNGRKMLINMPNTNGTSVALGIIGNDVGRNVIRIVSKFPALELFSTTNAISQKMATGVDVTGYYTSYDNTNTTDMTTQRQFQISQYGVRICKSIQVPYIERTLTEDGVARVSRAGYVGIGLVSANETLPKLPYYQLHVQGSVWVQSAAIPSTSNTSPCFYINEANARVGIRTNAPQRDFHVNGSAFVQSIETMIPVLTSSDLRLKEDLRPITHALDKVMQLTGYTFTRKKSGVRETGLVAQEVKSVLPEAVAFVCNTQSTRGADDMDIDGVDTTDYLGVKYGNLAGLFVEAIKTMSNRIEALEARLGVNDPGIERSSCWRCGGFIS